MFDPHNFKTVIRGRHFMLALLFVVLAPPVGLFFLPVWIYMRVKQQRHLKACPECRSRLGVESSSAAIISQPSEPDSSLGGQVEQRLTRLAELHAKALITEEEYEEKRRAVLRDM